MFRAYIELLKPRILVMQFVSFGFGYFLASPRQSGWMVLALALLGTALVSGGASAFNQFFEWRQDQLMDRTKNRPIPKGVIPARNALWFSLILVVVGTLILYFGVNLLTSVLALSTAVLYGLLYTPLKQMTWLNTFVGGVPGALPPLGGWAAATGHLDAVSWLLFLILFLWQLPHFFAIGWMYKDEYKAAGFQMISTQDPDGERTVWHMYVYTFLLILSTVLPVFVGMLSPFYGVFALVLGGYFLYSDYVFSKDRSKINAKKVLKTSVLYLPLLLGLMVIDKLLF